MKIAQYKKSLKIHPKNQSFQKEIWDSVWSEQSFNSLVAQLSKNPVYWRLKELIKNKDLILEAGCGFGQWVYRLDNQGFKIHGVDFAKQTIRLINKSNPRLKIKYSDVLNLPYLDKYFDVYLSFGVIEHFEQGPQKVLKEANRVLKKGGLLFLTIPYLNYFRWFRFRHDKKKKNEQFYQYLYSINEARKYIEDAGFEVKNIKKYDFITAFKKDFPTFANKLLKIEKKYTHQGGPTQKFPDNFKGEKKPNFIIQNLLYKIDSYIVLFEAYKK